MRAGIIDYRMGNLASVSKAMEAAGASFVISDQPDELSTVDLLVLPGVGNYAAGMANLTRLGLADFTVDWASSGRPLLGICMGMQMLYEESDEAPSGGTFPGAPPKPARGLGILEGRVEKFEVDLKVPHMGWNTIQPVGNSSIFEDFAGRYFYFVHSYCCRPAGAYTGTSTNYGVDFCSAVHQGNIIGAQFHPEKSSDDGIALYRRLLKEVA